MHLKMRNNMIEDLNKIKEFLPEGDISNRQEAYQMFMIGVVMNSPSFNAARLPMRQLADTLGVKLVKLTMAKSLAKRFDNSPDKFMRFLDSKQLDMKWAKLTQYIFGKQKSMQDILKGITGLTYHVLELIKCAEELKPEERREVYEKLISTRKILDKFAPFHEDIADKQYLRFSPCACCGEYPPPPEGFALISYANSVGAAIQYPVCPLCNKNGIAPDKDRIAEMYAGYAVSMEHAVDIITGIA